MLLHDTDRTAAPGSWKNTLAASAILLEQWAHHDVRIGALRDHW